MTHDPKFLWCRACEGVYTVSEVRRRICPLCGAARSPGTWMEWERFQSLHPNHPRVPTYGMRYRLTNIEAQAEQQHSTGAQAQGRPHILISAQEIPNEIIAHCVSQYALRGLFYGMIYGAFIGILSNFFLLLVEAFVGAIIGAVIGLVAGLALGLLNGVFLVAVRPYYLRQPEPKQEFILLARRISPLFTFFSALALCLTVTIVYAGGLSLLSPFIWLLFIFLPSLIAGFAAWQSARAMDIWYVE